MTEQTTTPLVSRTPASAAAVQERRDRTVALLLATAAVPAAIIATRASFLAGEAAGHWQQAVRSEIKRAAAMTVCSPVSRHHSVPVGPAARP